MMAVEQDIPAVSFGENIRICPSSAFELVIPVAAVEQIVTQSGFQGIVAAAAVEFVVVIVSFNSIVANSADKGAFILAASEDGIFLTSKINAP